MGFGACTWYSWYAGPLPVSAFAPDHLELLRGIRCKEGVAQVGGPQEVVHQGGLRQRQAGDKGGSREAARAGHGERDKEQEQRDSASHLEAALADVSGRQM